MPAHGELPKGSTVSIRGQAVTMSAAYGQLLVGLGFSIVLIYLLIVINFQSWLDPVRHRHGVAGGAGRHRLDAVPDDDACLRAGTDRRHHVHGRRHGELDPRHRLRPRAAARGRRTRVAASIAAGATRLRPVVMTALAMMIGMAPMAIEPGQNAPLGRAVIGGLLFATVATLFFVPVVFSIVHGRAGREPAATPLATPSPTA